MVGDLLWVSGGGFCTFQVKDEFTSELWRWEGEKSDDGIWHYSFSYTIQLFIMTPVSPVLPLLTPFKSLISVLEDNTLPRLDFSSSPATATNLMNTLLKCELKCQTRFPPAAHPAELKLPKIPHNLAVDES